MSGSTYVHNPKDLFWCWPGLKWLAALTKPHSLGQHTLPENSPGPQPSYDCPVFPRVPREQAAGKRNCPGSSRLLHAPGFPRLLLAGWGTSCTGQGSWGPHPQLLTWRLGAHCLAGDSLLSLRLRGPWEREQLWASCIDCSNSCCSQLPLSLGHSKTGRDPISCIYAEQAVMLQRQHLYCTPPASMGNLHMYHSWRLQKAKTQGPLTVSWELRLHLLPWRV